VGIFPDRGDRYTSTVYSDAYWAEHHVADLPLATAPAVVEYGAPIRQWSRAEMQQAHDLPERLLFVEADTCGAGMVALRAAQQRGLTPVLITAQPEQRARLDGTGIEALVCDTGSLPELCAVIQARFPRQEIVGVTTASNAYLPVVAELADWLGLPGSVPVGMVPAAELSAVAVPS
jgi:cysteine synthase A